MISKEIKTIEFLAKKVANKLDISIKDRLGKGTKGIAYGIDGDRVMKITKSFNEANIANKLKGKDLKYSVNYYMVKEIDGPDRIMDKFGQNYKDWYLIIMDKAEPLSRELIDKIFWTPTSGDKSYEKIIDICSDERYIEEFVKYGSEQNFKCIKGKLGDKDFKNFMSVIENIRNIFEELKNVGGLNVIQDFTPHNLGLKNDRIVMFDIMGGGGLGLDPDQKIRVEGEER